MMGDKKNVLRIVVENSAKLNEAYENLDEFLIMLAQLYKLN